MLKQDDLRRKLEFNRQRIAPALRSAGEDKLADKIAGCSEWSNVATCKGCGAKYYAGSFYCKSRFCAICAKMRALAWLAKLVPLLQNYISRGYAVFMLNLTIQDQNKLETGITAIRDAWRLMTHDDRESRAAFRALNSGGVRSLEVKLGSGSGIWHPHIHALTVYDLKTFGTARQFDSYRSLWERAVCNAFGSVDAAKLGSVDVRGIKQRNGEDGLLGAVVETFKYICKFQWLELPADKVAELVHDTKSKHFIAAWGELYKLNKQVEELLAQSSEDELKTRVCDVCGCSEFQLEYMLSDVIPPIVRDFKQ